MTAGLYWYDVVSATIHERLHNSCMPQMPYAPALHSFQHLSHEDVRRYALGVSGAQERRRGSVAPSPGDNGEMARRRPKARNPLFAKRWFSDDIIIRCVRWYLRYKLSYRDLAAIMSELGISVAPCTILRWVVRYSADFAQYWRCYKKPVGRSWRCDETYIKVGGQWMYLYRAVDERGSTVESHLSRTRDVAAAKAFFRKALKHHCHPR